MATARSRARTPGDVGISRTAEAVSRTMRVQIAAFCYLHAHGTRGLGVGGFFPRFGASLKSTNALLVLLEVLERAS